MFRYPVIAFLAILCAVGSRAAAGADHAAGRHSLEGTWKIALGDDSRYAAPEYDDRTWDTVSLPGSVMPYVMARTGTTSGILWLRKHLAMGADLPREDRGLILGRIANADETWFNGVRVGGMGSFPPREHSQWNHPRHYLVHRQFIHDGADNVVAVRVSYNLFGEMLGTLALTPLDDWEKSRLLSRFLLIDLDYIAIAMGLTLLIISLFFIIIRPSQQEYWYYWLQLFCGVFMIGELCSYWNLWGSLAVRFKILGVAWAAVNVAHPIFLHRIYNLERKKIERLLWIYLGAVVAAVLFIVDDQHLRAGGLGIIALTLPLGFYHISCHVSALRKGRPYAREFTIFGVIVVIGAIHDGLVYLLKFTGIELPLYEVAFQYMIFPYAACALYVGTSLVLVVRFTRMMEEVEELNTSLESFVVSNALLFQRIDEMQNTPRRSASPAITDRSAEKIQQVINYVHENYTFDISREGLAASVDVHPDNLGKFFKKYTKMKLGDYINELRVKDAAKKLAETDESVIQIAFSVGFDSLRTFNRVFPRIMNMTPEKYRRTHKAAK